MNKIVRRIVDDSALRQELIARCAAAGAPLTTQAIDQWKKSKSGIPPKRVHIVSRLLGLSPHEIRPDIFPPPSRSRKRASIKAKRGNNHAQQQRLF
jgi:DNA-binding transcriptional regulator YdaS (Cro superfamily)